MKKIFILLLAFSMMLSICACGSSGISGNGPGSAPAIEALPSIESCVQAIAYIFPDASISDYSYGTNDDNERVLTYKLNGLLRISLVLTEDDTVVQMYSMFVAKDLTQADLEIAMNAAMWGAYAFMNLHESNTYSLDDFSNILGEAMKEEDGFLQGKTTMGDFSVYGMFSVILNVSTISFSCRRMTLPPPCEHTFIDATCTTPKTCSLCGIIRGEALGHQWRYIMEDIEHPMLGHNEIVQQAEKVQRYRCEICYNKYATMADYYSHFDAEHPGNNEQQAFRERYSIVDDWEYHDEVVWVVDQEAYTENAAVGGKCVQCDLTEGIVTVEPNPCASGHTWIPATCSEPSTCSVCHQTIGTAQPHLWYDVKEFINYPEIGHNETVERAEKVQKFKCTICNKKYDALSEYYTHFDAKHPGQNEQLAFREAYGIVDDWKYHDEVVRVIDQAAYRETVVTGSKCSRCSATEGLVTVEPDPCAGGHSWIPATCSEPSTCSVCHQTIGTAQPHLWYDVVERIDHPEVGHYETVEKAEKVQKYKCAICSEKYSSLTDYYTHFDAKHPGQNEQLAFRERYNMVSDWEYHDEVEWVVDQAAYRETVVTGSKCSRCSATEGLVTVEPDLCAGGHTWIPATCSEPSTCAVCQQTIGVSQEHLWYAVKEFLSHPEAGHYETVEKAEKVQKYKCGLCSEKSSSKEEYYNHFDAKHPSQNEQLAFRERYTIVDDWEYHNEVVWVVDKEAYRETVITGMKCSRCGKTE